MIKAITITNHLGESIRLELSNPESSGFAIKKISGLGPVKATVNFTELVTNDGAIDNSARLQSRNIVMQLVFFPNPTIEDTRLLSYKYFPIKRNIKFLIETDNRVCETIGRVESNEPDIFSEEEGCQISIMCPDPYFYSKMKNEIIFYGVKPLFEFPFSNESLDKKLIEFGRIERYTQRNIVYDGDAEVGIIITMHAIGEVRGLVIYKIGTREIMRINDEKMIQLLGSGIQSGDEIVINTNKGSKGISILRRGTTINILNVLDRPTSWFQLSKGDNIFTYTAKSGLSNLKFKIENKVVYEGV